MLTQSLSVSYVTLQAQAPAPAQLLLFLTYPVWNGPGVFLSLKHALTLVHESCFSTCNALPFSQLAHKALPWHSGIRGLPRPPRPVVLSHHHLLLHVSFTYLFIIFYPYWSVSPWKQVFCCNHSCNLHAWNSMGPSYILDNLPNEVGVCHVRW